MQPVTLWQAGWRNAKRVKRGGDNRELAHARMRRALLLVVLAGVLTLGIAGIAYAAGPYWVGGAKWGSLQCHPRLARRVGVAVAGRRRSLRAQSHECRGSARVMETHPDGRIGVDGGHDPRFRGASSARYAAKGKPDDPAAIGPRSPAPEILRRPDSEEATHYSADGQEPQCEHLQESGRKEPPRTLRQPSYLDKA